MKKQNETHESWGVVGFYRNYGSERELFGSDVTNHNTIRLAIKQAKKQRDLGRDWTMGDNLICEVELSALQFAELLTNMNMGDGIPCTIRYTQKDGDIQYKSEKNKIDIIREEREKEIDDANTNLKEGINELSELINNKKIPKTIGSEILFKFKKALSSLEGSNYEFYKKQASEEIDNMIVEAKSQISEHINQKIYSVGLEALMNANEITPALNCENIIKDTEV